MILFQVTVLLTLCYLITIYIKFRAEAMRWHYWKIAFYRGTFFEDGVRPDTYCITNGNQYLSLGKGYLALHCIPQYAIKLNRVKWVYADDVRITVLHDKETAEKVLVALHKYYGTGGR